MYKWENKKAKVNIIMREQLHLYWLQRKKKNNCLLNYIYNISGFFLFVLFFRLLWSEVLKDKEQNIPYSVYLTVVDVKQGTYGMNLYYKMQVSF